MTISIRGSSEYKSIPAELAPIDLKDFSVVCGLNGSGKSHLLQALANGHVLLSIDGKAVDDSQIQVHSWADLTVRNSDELDATELWRNKEGWWERIQTAVLNDSLARPLKTDFEANWPDLAETDVLRTDFDSLPADTPSRQNAIQKLKRTRFQQLKNARSSLSNATMPGGSLAAVLDQVEFASGKEFWTLSKSEFDEFAPLSFREVNPFQQGLTELFLAYARADLDNWVKRHSHEEDSTQEAALSAAEFEARHGPVPWDFLNDLLRTGGYDFRVTQPETRTIDQKFKAQLIHQVHDKEIDFSDLSSGEQVLISILLLVYHLEDGRVRVNFPAVILLDEIDSPLHPSMIRRSIELIKRVLVDERGIKVVWTTHSPTTAAVAPEESLFRMNKTEPRLEPVSRTVAIRALTSGLPTLSVRPEVRRQVFTESHNDVTYLEAMREAIGPYLADSEFSLDLLPSSSSKGGSGCQVVVDMVTALRGSGLETVFGIVDWDGGKNDSTVELPGSVFWLGAPRHSIESFILDPLFIASYLLKEASGDKQSTRTQVLGDDGALGILGGLDQPNPPDELLQGVVDRMLKIIRPAAVPMDESTVPVITVGGNSLEYPEWFMNYRGHDLFELYASKFPSIRGRFGTNGEELSHAIVTSTLVHQGNLLDSRVKELFEDLGKADPAKHD